MSSYVHTVLRITYKFLNSQAKWWQVVSWRITGCWIRNLLPLSPLLPSTYIFSVALQLQLPNKKPRQQEKKVNGIESLNLCRNKVRGVTSGEVKTRTAQRVRQAKKNHTLAFIFTVCTVVVNCHAAGGHTHTHLKGDCRGFEGLIYPPHSHQHTHVQTHVIHRSLQEPLCSKPTAMHNKTDKDRNKDNSNSYLIPPF